MIIQAERGGFFSSMMGHVRRLCQALAAREITRESLTQFVESEAEGPVRRNAARVALELAEARLSVEEQEALLPLFGGEANQLRVRLALTSGRAELLGGETPEAGLARQLLAGVVPAELPEGCKTVGHATALHEAARRCDMAAVVANLEDHAAWREFSS